MDAAAKLVAFSTRDAHLFADAEAQIGAVFSAARRAVIAGGHDLVVADDDRAVASELVAEPLGLQQAVGRGPARADHGDDGLGVKIGQNALIIQHERRVVNVFEPLGIDGVLQRYDMDALPVALLQDLAGRGKLLIGE